MSVNKSFEIIDVESTMSGMRVGSLGSSFIIGFLVMFTSHPAYFQIIAS